MVDSKMEMNRAFLESTVSLLPGSRGLGLLRHMKRRGSRAWRRIHAALGSVCLGTLAVTFLVSGAAAEDGRLQLAYKIYFAGVHAANLGLGVRFDAAAYDADAAAYDLHATAYAVQARLKTTGLVKAVTRWRTTAYSHGALVSGDVVPVRAGYRSKRWWKKRLVELGFDRGTPKLVRMKPRKESRVSSSRLKGALDPAGAFLAVLASFDAGEECSLRIPVFDGRRLYALVGEADGAGHLEAGRHSPYAGATVNCRVWLERKAGFKRKSGNGGAHDDTVVQLRMARVFDEMPPVPVRFASDTGYGSLVAYLFRAELDADGLKRDLPPRPERRR